jgi:hypothetical protein
MRRLTGQLLRLIVVVAVFGVLVSALSIARDLREIEQDIEAMTIAIGKLEAHP